MCFILDQKPYDLRCQAWIDDVVLKRIEENLHGDFTDIYLSEKDLNIPHMILLKNLHRNNLKLTRLAGSFPVIFRISKKGKE